MHGLPSAGQELSEFRLKNSPTNLSTNTNFLNDFKNGRKQLYF